MHDRIVIAAALPGAPDRALDERFEVTRPADGVVMSTPELHAAMRNAAAVVPLLTHRIDAKTLASSPALRLVANVAVGYDNVDIQAATARGVLVTNTPDVLTEATADLTWALLLAVARQIPENDRFLREGRYHGWLPGLRLGSDVSGQTLGLVGLGRIGRAVALRARGFQMRVLYHQPDRLPLEEEREANATWVDLVTLLTESDFVSLHCPLTPETHHLMNRARLSLMKPTAYLLNTARGPLVDEAALAEALGLDRLAGAGLDVFEREPAVEQALLEQSRAVLLPHVGSATRSTREAMSRLAIESVLDLFSGRRPRHPVNPEVLDDR
jgi:glyoxylate reductase